MFLRGTPRPCQSGSIKVRNLNDVEFLDYIEYESNFSLISRSDLGIEIFEAPALDMKLYSSDMIIEHCSIGFMPDIYMLTNDFIVVSGLVKNIIEGADNINHQFFPINISGRKEIKYCPLGYYVLHVRRVVAMDDVPEQTFCPGNSVIASPYSRRERRFFEKVVSISDARDTLEKLFLWKIKRCRATVCLNVPMFSYLEENSVSGLWLENKSNSCRVLEYV